MHRLLLCLLFTAHARAQWTTSRIQGTPEPPRPFVAEQTFAGVTMNHALDMVAVPGGRRLVAVEEKGKVWSFPDSPETAEKTLLIDLKQGRPALSHAYGVAFHPRWRENGYVFLTYTLGDKLEDGTKLSRFKLAQAEPPVLDPASEVVLLTWLCGGHNGASIQFGPDGMLYVSTGDAAAPSPPDSLNTGQGLGDLLSCVLRLDVDREEGGRAYGIPPDNPFLSVAGARPEIWAFGFRNPWKMSFDAKGRLWCGDVGWELWEMIHLVRRGGNHGWSAMEASQPIKPETQGPGEIIPPVAAHPHTEAASITGGHVYEGARFPELRGAYIYGDYETGKIWALWHDGAQVTRREELADTPHKIVTFGLGQDGEIYWMNWERDTRIYRLARNPAAGNAAHFPRKLSETGLFADTAAQVPAAGVLPYEIAEPMWQDGASARRYVALPGGARIHTEVRGNPGRQTYQVRWPQGAVLARTVSLERRLETQVLHFDGEAWNGYSYRWDAEGRDAVLTGADGEEFSTGGRPWRIHGRAECMRCHTPWAGFALGFQPDQLVSIAGKPPAQAVEVLDAAFLDRLKNRLKPSRDAEAPLEDRARSWLHANCAHCHRRHGGGSVQLMVNADLPMAETLMLDEKPVRGTLGLEEARVIAPGRPERSVLLARIARGGPGHMPMIGAREVDPHGFRLLWEWIAGGQAAAAVPQRVETPSAALLAAHAIAEGHRAFDPALARHADAEVACYFERFIPQEQRVKTLGALFDPVKLLALPGDARRGAELMSLTGKMAACLACHLVQGAGRDFGPELTHVGARMDRAQLLESIHQPSRRIAQGYETWTLTLKDGTQHTGFLLQRSTEAVTLKLAGGQSQAFPVVEVTAQKMQPVSLMPEGLLQALTEQEAADLLAWLSSLK